MERYLGQIQTIKRTSKINNGYYCNDGVHLVADRPARAGSVDRRGIETTHCVQGTYFLFFAKMVKLAKWI